MPGQRLSLSIIAPPCLGAGPIAYGIPVFVNIDSTVLTAQSGATGFLIGGVFDIHTVISIRADQRSVGSSSFSKVPTVPVISGVKPWNYWGPLNVTFVTAPTTFALLVEGAPIVDAYRTLGIAPSREVRAVFQSIKNLGVVV